MADDGDAERLAWWTFGALITAVVAFTLYRFLGALVFAVFAYYASRPLYRRIDRRTDHPDVAATITLLAFTIPVIALLGYTAVVAARELHQALGSTPLSSYRSVLDPYATLARRGDFRRLASTLLRNPTQPLGPEMQRLLRTVAGAAFAFLVRLFLATVFVFYLLRDDQRIADWFAGVLHHDDDAVRFAENVDDDLETLFFGNLATIVATSAIATVTYMALNFLVPQAASTALVHPVLLGLLTGVATLVPVVGMKIVYLPYNAYLVVAAVTSPSIPLWFPVVFFAVTFVVVDTVPDYFVRAYLSAGELHLGLVMLAYILGTMAFGWKGLFLGPLLLVPFVHFARTVLPRLTRRVFTP